MEFSKLRHRITFLKPDGEETNSMGELVPVYTPLRTVWANVSPMNGREYAEAQKIRAETTYNITTRYWPDITTEMRISFQGRVFEIVSVLHLGSLQEQLKIIATEADRNGNDG